MNYTKFMMGVSCLRGRLRNDGTRVGAKTDFIFTCNTLFLCKVFEERRKNKVKNALLLGFCHQQMPRNYKHFPSDTHA